MTSNYCLLFVAFTFVVCILSHADSSNAAAKSKVNQMNRTLSDATKRKLEEVFTILRSSNWASQLLRRLKEEKSRRQAALEAAELELLDEHTPVKTAADARESRTNTDGTLVDAIRRLRRSAPNSPNDQALMPDFAADGQPSQKPDKSSTDVGQITNQRLELTETFSGDLISEVQVTSNSRVTPVNIDATAADGMRTDNLLDAAKHVDQYGTSGNPPHSATTTERPSHHKHPTRFSVVYENLSEGETQATEKIVSEITSAESTQSFYSSSGSDQPSFAGDSPSSTDRDKPDVDNTNEHAAAPPSAPVWEALEVESIEIYFPPCPEDVDFTCEYGECVDLGFELYSCSCDQGFVGVSCEHMDLKAVLVEIRYIGGVSDPEAAANENPAAYSSAVVVAQYLSGEVKMFR